jgi:hypothetical protein
MLTFNATTLTSQLEGSFERMSHKTGIVSDQPSSGIHFLTNTIFMPVKADNI